ncbi:LytTR family DNA-binding domain-containing protein [uncultured Stenotrophomonas sp.]|uniref:LytTR family DNA-binding domain-containing protein n=1 Tax=uncultured Stenotrophomonas sp. TaxID=165438 RepID=UPI0028E85D42|nr:LytTR family DNA-binding domain-containing protein [uncultured Stenotrophomonas sp.]
MTALAERLDPRHVARVHRSTIVTIARVKTIHPSFNGHRVTTLDTSQELRMWQTPVILKLPHQLRGHRPRAVAPYP